MQLTALMAAGFVALSPPQDTSCAAQMARIDDYLVTLYTLAPKVDQKGDFAWKDPKAAQRFGLRIDRYVIGGMEPKFKCRLYNMMRAAEAAGFEPGITSGFRCAYRQALAVGNKSSDHSSFHGSRPGYGYGHSVAADVVSLGMNRADQLRKNAKLYLWIDEYGKRFKIGRPYGDGDAPHVAPLGSEEFAIAAARKAAKLKIAKAKKHHGPKKKVRIAQK
jgi:hypothetical protein